MSSTDFFSISIFSKDYFRNTMRFSNCFDPDQARHFVGPDLDTNCLQKLSIGDTSGQIVERVKKNGEFVTLYNS